MWIRFELMVELAAVERALIYDGGIVLTGYDTALVATDRTATSVQWHVFYLDISAGVRRTWLDKNGSPIFDRVRNRLKETDLEQLKILAYLRWAKEVDVVLGTQPLVHERMPRRVPYCDATHEDSVSGFSRALTFGFGLGPICHFLDINLGGSYMQTQTREGLRPSKILRKHYERRFWDNYRQVVVIYDAAHGRASLVPKVNVVLLLVRMYMANASLTSPLSILYPTKRAEDRDVLDHDAWKAIESLKEQHIEQHGGGPVSQKFGDLFMDFAEELYLSLERIEARDNCGRYCIELMDIFDGKIGSLKYFRHENGIANWLGLLHGVGVVVCRGLGPALTIQPEEKQLESDRILCSSNSLCCTIGDLKLLIEQQSCSEWESYREKGYIEKPDKWIWILANDPFGDECRRNDGIRPCAIACWHKRMQCIDKGTLQIRNDSTRPTFTMENMNSGLCFGELHPQTV